MKFSIYIFAIIAVDLILENIDLMSVSADSVHNYSRVHFISLIRLETVNFKKLHSTAKVVGTLITVIGAMVMTLYKGPIIDIIRGGGQSHHKTGSDQSSDQHWVTGTLMLLGSIGSWAGFFILQVSKTNLSPLSNHDSLNLQTI